MIICCGDALVDMLPEQLADGREAYLPVPGGAMYNTAIALGRLGEEAGFFSGFSTDMFGQQLTAHLEDSGVSTAWCVHKPNPTTLAFVKLEEGVARYTFLDENTASRMLSVEALPTFPRSVQALHFGAISLISEPCGSAYEELMSRMRNSAVISFDPNIRPGFVTNELAYRERLRRMMAMSDIIKVSEDDLDWMEPGGQFEHIAHNRVEGGASVVIMTMGAEGARAITETVDITVPATPATVVDTVGAGDTFNAGFLASLRASGVLSKQQLKDLDENTLQTAIEYGSKVAAFTVGQAGANPPWLHELTGDTGSV
ncbi:carbohydrate kinase [Solemya velum gill symbiont]|uniref:carbohydrate kinase family protein n=1 Tax=Solemya velum gill symbiont TaxID=2340 RepID=UPI000996A787|nr:carbohydrate kinase [Solemya velum gill symbiont]OOZ76714.1 carbohydrate kinase [Solemya velum gill symbiont]